MGRGQEVLSSQSWKSPAEKTAIENHVMSDGPLISTAKNGKDLSVVAVIPARGGSKGIQQKNLVKIAGRPLIEYSIEHAQATAMISEVVISTDDREIAEVSSELGATVVERPDHLARDEATSETAILHVLDVLRARDSRDPDLVVFLQATSPLRSDVAIDEAIETLIASRADSLFSACTQHGFVWQIGQESVESVTYDYLHRPRRQESPEHVVENGSIYVFKPWVLRELGNRLGGRIAVYRMSVLHSFQIDEPEDVEVIETLLKMLDASNEIARDRRGL